MALARPVPLDVDDLHAERLLALGLIRQAVSDLDNAAQRARAATFLCDGLWDTVWHGWLPELRRPAVRAFVQARLAQPPRRSGVKVGPDGRETESG